MQQGSLAELNAILDRLQNLAERLDPMEAAYAEVRFLDVDFEQLEKQYEDVFSQMRAELDHEKTMCNAIEQLNREATELIGQIASLESTTTTIEGGSNNNQSILQWIQQTTVPALYAKLGELRKGNAQANNTRVHVQRLGGTPSLDDIEQMIANANARATELSAQIERERTEAVVKKIQEVLVLAEVNIPENDQILECANELKQLPMTDPRTDELCQQVEELKWKKRRKDALQNKIDEHLGTIAPKLEELGDKFGMEDIVVAQKQQTKQKGRKTKKKKEKKSKKQAQEEEKSTTTKQQRDEHIHELRKAIELLKGDILPALGGELQREALQEGIPMAPTNEQLEQQATANNLMQTLNVSV